LSTRRWLLRVAGLGRSFWLRFAVFLWGRISVLRSRILRGIALAVGIRLRLRFRSARALLGVVGHVPARSLELHGGRGDHLLDLAAAFRALLHHRVRKSLDALKAMTAFLALIFVKGHGRNVRVGHSLRLAQGSLCPTTATSEAILASRLYLHSHDWATALRLRFAQTLSGHLLASARTRMSEAHSISQQHAVLHSA